MNPWSLLTVRGRSLLIVGLLGSAATFVLGQRDLAWASLLIALLPLAALLNVGLPLWRIEPRREVRPTQFPVDHQADVRLRLSAGRRFAIGLLHFEDVVPPDLGTRPRFRLHNLLGDWRREVSYAITGYGRGRHRLGPLLVRSFDALGLAHRDRALDVLTDVLVTPKVYELDPAAVGSQGVSADASQHRSGLVGQDDVLVREYQHGDDVRRVHWRSTARHERLMVRREEQAWDPRAKVVLDSRLVAHGGDGSASSFEWAVSAVTSICLHLLQRGFQLSVLDSQGLLDIGVDADRTTVADRLLPVMAEEVLSGQASLRHSLSSGSHARTELVIAVLGRLSATDLALLVDSEVGLTGVLFLLDVPTFAGLGHDSTLANTAATLRDHRWQVVVVDAETTVTAAWEQLRRSRENQ